jgi:hypothetical protein
VKFLEALVEGGHREDTTNHLSYDIVTSKYIYVLYSLHPYLCPLAVGLPTNIYAYPPRKAGNNSEVVRAQAFARVVHACPHAFAMSGNRYHTCNEFCAGQVVRHGAVQKAPIEGQLAARLRGRRVPGLYPSTAILRLQ